MERTLKAVNGSLNVTIPRGLADDLGWRKGDRIAFQRTERGLAMHTATPTQKLRTVGYEGHTLDSFVALLKRSGVKQLLDIRDLPLSRRRGFSKTPLRDALHDAGIMYEHVRDLGAPKAVRAPYIAGGSATAFRTAYMEHLSHHRVALDGVKWHMGQAITAIMCVERQHTECHRGIVAAELEKDGVVVEHL